MRIEMVNGLSDASEEETGLTVNEPVLAVSPLVIRLFGPFEVTIHGSALPRLRSRKGQSLLALLALRSGAAVERAWLAAILWPDSPEPQALAGLRNTLTDLRRALSSEAYRLQSPTPHSLSLDLTGAQTDVIAFDAAIARGDAPSLEQAVELYRGPLLEGCVEEWVFQERQIREQEYLEALETLAAQSMAEDKPGVAERYLRRAVAAEPLRESAQRSLLQALAAGGNYGGALLAYRDLRHLLHREVNTEPDAETRTLFEQIRAEAQSRARAPRPAPSPASSPRVSAPPATSEDTITFLFTEIEGSSTLGNQHQAMRPAALARHDALLRQAIEAKGGRVFKTGDEGFCAAFNTAPEALEAALTAQCALLHGPGSEPAPLWVRMALHTGAAEVRDDDFSGPPLKRAARLLTIGHGGQILLSLATGQLVREALPDGAGLRDMGLHRLQDLQVPEQVFQLLHPDLPDEFPPLRSLESFPNNLPLQLTSFIGRERDIADVRSRLAATRLLTLTGAGGCGKTRLALQVAADLLEEYEGGVWLVELTALTDPALAPQAVASALGIREEPGRPLAATLVEYMRPRSMLLVLDNCEHLVAACAALADLLLRACPQLRILATSREALGIAGEMAYRVPSLSLPPPVEGRWCQPFRGYPARRPAETGGDGPSTHLPLPSLLLEYEAARLFVERAAFSQPAFAVTDFNAPAVAQVCRRLDGIPLAIELAAARVKFLTVEQIAVRLDDRFQLLTGGSRTAWPRQQTLRAAIDWSHDLLAGAERTLLRRLSVFTGGWTLEAAETVCAGTGIERSEVLDLLCQLVEKSLVVQDELAGEARFRLLETIRQYSAERLRESGEEAAWRDRHRDWFLKLAQQAEPHLSGIEQAGWLDRLECEHENLRAALDWSLASGAAEVALRMTGALWRFWHVRGYLQEGRERLNAALEAPAAAERSLARAKALDAAGALAHDQGDLSRVAALHEESLAIAREWEDQETIASALNNLGNVALDQGRDLEAEQFYEEALALWRAMGNKKGVARLLNNLGGMAQDRGDDEKAVRLYEESLVLKEELGDQGGIARSLNNLGSLAMRQGAHEKAAVFLDDSLALFRQLGDSYGIAVSLTNRGQLALLQDHREQGLTLHEEGLRLGARLGNMLVVAGSLTGIAGVLTASERPLEAARLYGKAEALRSAAGSPLPDSEQAAADQSITAARVQVEESAWTVAWAEGQQMSLDQAVSFAIDQSSLSRARLRH